MNDIEKKLSALNPTSQDDLANQILRTLDNRKAKPACLPYLYSGFAGSLVGAAAMFLVMCTLAKPPVVVVQEIVREVSVEPTPPLPTPPPVQRGVNPAANVDYRPEIAVFGIRLAPPRNNTLDLDAMLAERAEIARRSRPMVASVYPKFEIGRREMNLGFSPQEYQTLLETML